MLTAGSTDWPTRRKGREMEREGIENVQNDSTRSRVVGVKSKATSCFFPPAM